MSESIQSEQVLLRLSGEIGITGRATRSQFVRRLLRNARDALASVGVAPRIRSSHDRMFAELPGGSAADEAVAALTRVFGLQSVSRVETRPAERLETVVAAGVELFRDHVRDRRFAVRARRVGNRDRIVLRPDEVERELGAALLPGAARVDLTDPEVTVGVELFESEAHFFPARIPGPGGLPLGVEGRALALLSGGFDSAVSAWQLMRRGVSIDYVFCNLGGRTHEQGVLRVAKLLADQWSYGERPRLHAVDFEPLVAELQARCETRYWQVLLKRLMLRAAECVARERGAAALVTGEAVGQVSSQTLTNLAVISRAVELPILRPLVGSNKDEIIAGARRIGTYELSKVVGEYCAMVPSRPATAASLDAILAQESRIDASLVERVAEQRAVFDLRHLDLEKLELPELEVERIPEGATVLDLRSAEAYASWHYPEALRLDFAHAVRAYPSFDRSQTYVLYCEIGLKSAHLAELMRREGFDAHHFKGGLGPLRRRAEASAVS